jgi:hypothetical protein
MIERVIKNPLGNEFRPDRDRLALPVRRLQEVRIVTGQLVATEPGIGVPQGNTPDRDRTEADRAAGRSGELGVLEGEAAQCAQQHVSHRGKPQPQLVSAHRRRRGAVGAVPNRLGPALAPRDNDHLLLFWPSLETPSLWASSSRLLEELGPIGRDALLRFAQVHSTLPHLHRQKILDRIFFLEEPLGKRDSGRSALRPYVVPKCRPHRAPVRSDGPIRSFDFPRSYLRGAAGCTIPKSSLFPLPAWRHRECTWW